MRRWQPEDIGDFLAGIFVGLLAHVLQVPMFLGAAFGLNAVDPIVASAADYLLLYIGVSQFLYIGPLLFFLWLSHRDEVFKGVCFAAILTCAVDTVFVGLW